MAKSIVIVGPQGCGKTLNAKALMKAFGMQKWIEADDMEWHRNASLPKQNHLILANEVPPGAKGLKVIQFFEAIKKAPKPHPSTPKKSA